MGSPRYERWALAERKTQQSRLEEIQSLSLMANL
jgi:hypothetical protein